MRRLFLVALLVGCEEQGGGPDQIVGPTITVAATPDFVGFPTTLAAMSDGGAASYDWAIIAAPSGSQLSATLAGSGATISFEPDVGGQWEVSVDSGDAHGSVRFTVPTVPVFFLEGHTSPEEKALGVVRSDGSGHHLISCPTTGAGALASMRFEVLYGMRSFEPPSGPVRHVFLEIVPTGSMTSDFRLWAADENTDCMSQPPRRIDSVGLFNDHAHFWPRFSPDGNRVMYVDQPQDQTQATYRIVTVNFDDTEEFIVRSRMLQLVGAAPMWLDATHVAWVENAAASGPAHLIVYQATDGNSQGDPGGDVSVLLDCGTQLKAINQLERAGGALIVAAASASTGATAIYRMPIGQCTLAQPLGLVPAGNMAADFALSPDGQWVVFSSTGDEAIPDGGSAPRRDLWRVPADGSQPAARFLGDPDADDVGPRFVAGGRQLTWTQVVDVPAPYGAGVMIANADGTHVRSLAAEDADGGVRIAGGTSLGTSCSYAPAGGSPWALVVLMAFRRRRRRPPADRRASADSRTRC